MKQSLRDILISALALMLIAGIVTAALAGTNALTKDTIADRTEQIENAARSEVIDASEFKKATVTVADNEVVYYNAVKDGKVVGYVFTAVSTGKSSGLTVMTAIDAEGKITGVKVTEDNETAGYVQKIEKKGFLAAFAGKEASAPITDVDAVSQATKTSNGVTKAVNQAIEWYQAIQGGAGND